MSAAREAPTSPCGRVGGRCLAIPDRRWSSPSRRSAVASTARTGPKVERARTILVRPPRSVIAALGPVRSPGHRRRLSTHPCTLRIRPRRQGPSSSVARVPYPLGRPPAATAGASSPAGTPVTWTRPSMIRQAVGPDHRPQNFPDLAHRRLLPINPGTPTALWSLRGADRRRSRIGVVVGPCRGEGDPQGDAPRRKGRQM